MSQDDLQKDLSVLVVDDTVVYRRILQNVVGEISGARVVGVAANGRIALDRLAQLEVDVVLLDVVMPEMDGIEALTIIRQRWPDVGVVLVSGADRQSADLTMRALELGALDFVAKADTGDLQRNQRQLVLQLSAILRGFVVRRDLGRRGRAIGANEPKLATRSSMSIEVRPAPTKPNLDAGAAQQSPVIRKVSAERDRPSVTSALRSLAPSPEVLAIGCSTGGPQALAKIVPGLPAELGVPVLIVQHMPPVFTASLAESLNRSCALRVVEATEHQLIESNVVYIAPGGRHMVVFGERGRTERRIVLTDEAPVNSCRPSVDVLFRSVANVYAGRALSVVLTGMGEDGLEGVRALHLAGGLTLTQSEESCVVYGMPRAVDLAGLSDERVPLENMAPRILKWLRQGSVRRLPTDGGR
jgi:two-component system, chemotaxis family, protein-glutamate methylesterase/glutaminase